MQQETVESIYSSSTMPAKLPDVEQTNPIKRVAMLSVHTCPVASLGGHKTGGMNVYVRELSRELGRQGMQVDIFTRMQKGCEPPINHEVGYGGRVVHIPAGPQEIKPVANVIHHLDEFTDGVLEFTHKEGIAYDVIHSHYWLSGLVAQKLQKAWHKPKAENAGFDLGVKKLPIIQMFHTLGHIKNQIATDDSQRSPQARVEGEEQVVELADTLIAATPAEKTQLMDYYNADPEKIQIISPGVNLDRFHRIDKAEARRCLNLPPHKKLILLVGRIEPLKGIDTLIDASAILKNQHKQEYRLADDFNTLIIGGDPWATNRDPEMVRLQELSCQHELCHTVHFLGAKDQDELPYYYAAADVVVMPSHYESFGMVALEAMAMGTPVIASNVGGLSYLVRDGYNGLHISARDAEALADRIHRILSDEVYAQRLGAQARCHAQEFGWERIANQIQRVYR